MNGVDKVIVEWFNTDFGTSFSGGVFGNVCLVAVSLLATLLLAGALGFEREYHGHNAGLRTHLMVALGSCAIMYLSIYGFGYWDATMGTSRDPARLAAQVVSGIGFLGAGTIIQNGVSVKGLTTATTLWVAMAIGLACGTGYFVLASCITAIAFLVLVGLARLEEYANRKNPHIVIVVPADQPVMRSIIEIGNRFGIKLNETSTELITFQESQALRVIIHCSYAKTVKISAFVDELRSSLHPLELDVGAIFK